MICETCHGRRFIERRAAGECPREEPCPECGGFGIVHCCEGERAGNVETEAASLSRRNQPRGSTTPNVNCPAFGTFPRQHRPIRLPTTRSLDALPTS